MSRHTHQLNAVVGNLTLSLLVSSKYPHVGFPTRFLPKPKNRVTRSFFKTEKPVLAACKPGFSVLNFDLQMSHYTTILTQTACNVHDSMFLFVYIYHWRPGPAGFTLHSSKSFIDIALLLLTQWVGMCVPAVDRGLVSHHWLWLTADA